jgi:PP-loop superfamily ATP-utilizing enzyme
MLIGTSLSQIPEIDFKLINEGIAKCSRDFFICSENHSDIACLLSRIGEWAEIVSKNDLEEIVKEKIVETKA